MAFKFEALPPQLLVRIAEYAGTPWTGSASAVGYAGACRSLLDAAQTVHARAVTIRLGYKVSASSANKVSWKDDAETRERKEVAGRAETAAAAAAAFEHTAPIVWSPIFVGPLDSVKLTDTESEEALPPSTLLRYLADPRSRFRELVARAGSVRMNLDFWTLFELRDASLDGYASEKAKGEGKGEGEKGADKDDDEGEKGADKDDDEGEKGEEEEEEDAGCDDENYKPSTGDDAVDAAGAAQLRELLCLDGVRLYVLFSSTESQEWDEAMHSRWAGVLRSFPNITDLDYSYRDGHGGSVIELMQSAAQRFPLARAAQPIRLTGSDDWCYSGDWSDQGLYLQVCQEVSKRLRSCGCACCLPTCLPSCLPACLPACLRVMRSRVRRFSRAAAPAARALRAYALLTLAAPHHAEPERTPTCLLLPPPAPGLPMPMSMRVHVLVSTCR